ncbi:glycosyltransferase [Streptomyces sp. NPDC006265]|uniref:glycosyltransferase n=1 Tax=Streptomyces sp. NPDC006265 TaxID=3156740 RepID=UPI0033A84061
MGCSAGGSTWSTSSASTSTGACSRCWSACRPFPAPSAPSVATLSWESAGSVRTALAEDTDLTMALWRAGWRVVYEESAVAWTEVPTSLRQLWRQRYRWCYGTLQAMWKHRGAVVEVGAAGRFARRGLSYLAVFQVVLPLLAPVVDLFAVYGAARRVVRGGHSHSARPAPNVTGTRCDVRDAWCAVTLL